MSTGFSGNLGYSIPKNWAFDQFHEFEFSSSPNFPLDKDAYSGRDKGISKFNTPDDSSIQLSDVEIKKYRYIYGLLEKVGYPIYNLSGGFSFNTTIPLGGNDLGVFNLATYLEVSTQISSHKETFYNLSITTNSDGSLSTECKDKISHISSKIKPSLKDKTNGVNDYIERICLQMGNVEISIGYKFLNDSLAEFNIIFHNPKVDLTDSFTESIDVGLTFKLKIRKLKYVFILKSIEAIDHLKEEITGFTFSLASFLGEVTDNEEEELLVISEILLLLLIFLGILALA